MGAKRKATGDRSFRLAGVVRAMNFARRRLAGGVPPAEAEALLAWVDEVVGAVDDACRKRGVPPSKLPAPTYQAYLYLRAIARDRPVAGRGKVAGPGRAGCDPGQVRVANLVAAAARLRSEMVDLVQAGTAAPVPAASGALPPEAWSGPRARALLERVRASAARVEGLAGRSPGGLAALPAPSLRAYRWLKLLSDERAFRSHLAGLDRARRAAAEAIPAAAKAGPAVPVRLDFYNQASLYRARRGPDGLDITASEGFVDAPPEILRDIVLAAARGTSARRSRGGPASSLARVRAWATGEAFRRVCAALAAGPHPGRPETRGLHHDLGDLFERVNAACFAGRLDRPNLAWSAAPWQRKLGQYQPGTDTVTLNVALDDAGVPPAVIEYVMFHELLHKSLGVGVVNGRGRAHTRAFREEERKFPGYAGVQDFLRDFGRRR